jgi:RNA polymerase sigma factor (sigma-70 family)
MTRELRTSPNHLLHRLFDEGTAAGLSDAQLAERFARTRDHEAFSALVARHGPMVMAVCRGLLGPSGDADDAFQATFLILLKRIGTFPVGQSLGGWLYRVARRVSRQARLSGARRRRREATTKAREQSTRECDPGRTEMLGVIRQEIDLLPERYRAPIVLCDLQGLTRNEAAELLGCPAGTVGGRLARARKRLRDRLKRRGVEPSVALPFTPELALTAAAWRTSLEAATRTASLFAAGNPATPAALSLAARSTRIVAAVPVMAALAVCLTIGMIAARSAIQPPKVPAKKSAASADPPPKPAAVPVSDPDDPKRAGHFAGRVTGPDGQPVKGARLFVVPQDSAAASRGPIRALSGADGRFEFDAPDLTYTELDGLPARRTGLLIASADGYAPDSLVTWGQTRGSFHSHWDPIKGADLTLRLVRDDVPIHGRLLDHEGRPLAGARVRVATLQVPWNHDLDAHLKKFSLSKNEVWMFDYERSVYRPELLPGVDREAVTDGDSRFKISGLGRDRLVNLIVMAPSVVQTQLTVTTRDAPDIVLDQWRSILGANFTLRLRAGRTVSGVVRDRETHEPIPGIPVGNHALDVMAQRNGDHPAVTDAKGRFMISGIDPLVVPLELRAVPRPGQPYLIAKGVANGTDEVVIEARRGIPFRLKVVDDAGEPVDADVEYHFVTPNPHFDACLGNGAYNNVWPLSRASRRAKGLYEGIAIPGPGAVLVKTPGRPNYRPARVDPKAFFAPGKTDWTLQDLYTTYGSEDTLSLGGVLLQNDYAAIVLVNSPTDSKPLELSTTVGLVKPREVTILDPEGHPVVGVQTEGLTWEPYDREPRLRAASFAITNLHAVRGRRITFVKEDRKLIGFLLARADGEAPYTVRMKPWATVTGRIFDENGQPLTAVGSPTKQQIPAILGMKIRSKLASHDDPDAGELHDLNTDFDGRFRIEKLFPGQRYSAAVYRGIGWYAGPAFENLVLQPGEVRDLGDIRTKVPVDLRGK